MKERDALRVKRGKGMKIEWDVENVIDGIWVHPLAEEWFYSVVKAVVEKLAPSMLPKVRWSSMRSQPQY